MLAHCRVGAQRENDDTHQCDGTPSNRCLSHAIERDALRSAKLEIGPESCLRNREFFPAAEMGDRFCDVSGPVGTAMQGDFRLGDWLVQPALCRLSKDGRSFQVRTKVMDLLTYLAEHPGEVIPKGRLLDDVWGSQAISESALTRTVTELRQALGDDAEQPRLLETIPKRGYRLIGPVAPAPEAVNPPASGQAHRVSTRSKAVLAAGAVAA